MNSGGIRVLLSQNLLPSISTKRKIYIGSLGFSLSDTFIYVDIVQNYCTMSGYFASGK